MSDPKVPILDFSKLPAPSRPGDPTPPTVAEFAAMRPGDPVMLATLRPGAVYQSPSGGAYCQVVRVLPKGGLRVLSLITGMESSVLNPHHEVTPMLAPVPLGHGQIVIPDPACPWCRAHVSHTLDQHTATYISPDDAYPAPVPNPDSACHFCQAGTAHTWRQHTAEVPYL